MNPLYFLRGGVPDPRLTIICSELTKSMNKTYPKITASPVTIEGAGPCLTAEHILLSIVIMHEPSSAGQLDDSCARQVEEQIKRYHGVRSVDARVLYNHSKRDVHVENCQCHLCDPKPL